MIRRLYLMMVLSFVVAAVTAQTYKSFKAEVYGTGEPIIFIPGYSCSGEVWKETVEHFKSRYTCHVLTLAGFAGVPAVETPILETVKNDLISYVKNNQLNKPVLVGHSLGAFMSLWVSSEEPALFGKLVCVDGLPFISAVNNPLADAETIKKDPNYNMETVIRNFENLPDSGFIERTAQAMQWQVNDTARGRQIATWQFLSNRRTLGATLIEMSTTDLRKEISKITQPVMVLGSIYETRESSVKILGEQYKNLPQANIKIATSKHFIMYDQPDWMYNEIDLFLAN